MKLSYPPASTADEDSAKLFRVSEPCILSSAMACVDKTSCNIISKLLRTIQK